MAAFAYTRHHARPPSVWLVRGPSRRHRVDELSPFSEAAEQAADKDEGKQRGCDPQRHVQVALEVLACDRGHLVHRLGPPWVGCHVRRGKLHQPTADQIAGDQLELVRAEEGVELDGALRVEAVAVLRAPLLLEELAEHGRRRFGRLVDRVDARAGLLGRRIPQVAQRNASHCRVAERNAQELFKLVGVLSRVESGDGEARDKDGQLHLFQHVEPVLDGRCVYLAVKGGLHSNGANGHAARGHCPNHVVVRLSVGQRQRVEHVHLAGQLDRRRVCLVGPPIRVHPQLIAAPVEPLAPVQRPTPDLVAGEAALEVRNVSDQPLVQMGLKVLAGQLVGPMVLAAMPTVEEYAAHAGPPLVLGPVEQLLDGSLRARQVARRRLIPKPLQMLLDCASPKVLCSRLQVPLVVGRRHAGSVCHWLGLEVDANRELMP